MKKNGYTLVELIITMALLALASTVIIVNMQGVESKQNKSLKERRIAEIEKAACSAIDSLQAEIITGQNRDNCLADGCKIKLSKLVSEGIIDEDLEFDSDGTKIVDIKDLYLVSIKWDTTSDGYKEKKCEFELRDFGTEPIDPEPTPDPNPDPGPTPDPVEPEDPNPNPVSFAYTGSEQTFIVPKTGTYKLETWGAQGGNFDSKFIGGTGGYSIGYLKLTKNQTLYINVGGAGSYCKIADFTNSCSVSSSYNGGGSCSTLKEYFNNDIDYRVCGSGGGATHIATKSGLLSTLENSKDDILIVSGGGGGLVIANYPYNCGAGGSGGGVIANDSTNLCRDQHIGTGGTNSKGYAFGTSGDNFGSGGGGGYYGGSGNISGGGGGSGYIGNSLLTNKVMYCYNCEESSEESTKTISTTCAEETPTSNCAKKGNGYAIISYVK